MPDDVRAACARVQDALRTSLSGASFPPPQNFHCTLAFLGEVADADALAIRLRALRCGVVHSGLGVLGAFPNPKRARVVWAGLTGDFQPLATEVRAAAHGARIPIEDRPFRAHVTLARLRAPGRVALDATIEPIAFVVDRVTLMRSTLRGARAPLYESLECFPLRA